MKLTDRAIVNLKATGKAHKHFDGGGLYVQVSPTGGKLWRMVYRIDGKQQVLSFGAYPAITLKRARERRDEIKTLLAEGIDPRVHKKEMEKVTVKSKDTFEVISREWHIISRTKWKGEHGEKILARLEKDIFPYIGKMPIETIKPTDLLTAIRHIEERRAFETAHRTLQICGKIFRYAALCGRAVQDITQGMSEVLVQPQKKHYSTITNPVEVGKLLRSIDNHQGQYTVACALKLAPLVFLRPGELRKGEWSEVNFDLAEWRIPAEKMKMKEQHIVPLARQTISLLKELYLFSGNGKYLFPGLRTDTRPISDNTINAGLRRLGYGKEEMTCHGFRSMASTLLNEKGWNPDAIERQLAHGERNKVRASYNFAEYLPERREMMQAWADYLDKLKDETVS